MTVSSLAGFNAPSPLMAMFAALLAVALRSGSPNTKAIAAASFSVILLHMVTWLFYGPGIAIHAWLALAGLSVILPLALRSRLTYPLFVAAGALLATAAMLLSAAQPAPFADALRLTASFGNLVWFVALASGIALEARRPEKAPRSTQRTWP